MHDVVLALALGEVHPRHPLIGSEAAQRGAEPIADLARWGARGDRQPEMAVHEGDQPGRVLQPGDVGVELRLVDALDLEHHVFGQNSGDGAR